MAGKGGYQRPTNPAPVSGPGSMSQRTDGGPSQPIREITGGDYGDNQELRTVQQSAPMAASGVSQTKGQWNQPQPPTAAPSSPPPGDLFRGSERPNEPLTAGAPFGDGSGPEALTAPDSTGQDFTVLSSYLPSLLSMAAKDDAPVGFVRFVHQLRDRSNANGVSR